jgi:hypothetical protein
VRVVTQALPHVGGERFEVVDDGAFTHARLPTVEIGPDRLAVLSRWRAIAEIVHPCRRNACTSMSSSRVSMSGRGSFDELARGQRPPASKEPRPTPWSHAGWGLSMSRSGDFQMSVIKSTVSEMAKDLDEQVAAFRTRPLNEGPYTFVAEQLGR